jgi:xanthine dehydrogenase accessory factor
VSARLCVQLAATLAHEAVVLATVLDTRGAVPRHRGAQMLIGATQTWFSVGGGRLEARVVDRERALLHAQRTQALLAIDLTGREGGEGICGGSMQVALRLWHGGADRERAAALAAALHAGDPITLSASELGADAEQRLEADARLLILGAGHCGLALYQAARALDYQIFVYDSRAEGYEHSAFDAATCLVDAAALGASLHTSRRVDAVLLNRDYHADVAALRVLATRPPRFVGMMGSRKRIGEVFAALPELREFCASVQAPVGLELGAETPEEIAISILAQLIAARRGVG